jgi:ribosomal protein L20
MKRIIILVLLVASSFYCIAQTKPSYVYKVDIDYVSGMIKLDTTTNGRIKDLKVGQILQVSILNLPSTYKVSGETIFENDKMEGSSIFNGLINKGLEPSGEQNNTANNTTQSYKDSVQKNLDSLNEETKGLDKALQLFKNKILNSTDKVLNTKDIDSINKFIAEKNYKTDIDNLKNTFSISDVKHFLEGLENEKVINPKKIIGNNSSLEKALADLNDQQNRVIKNAQDNIRDRKQKNDSIRKIYAMRIDSLQGIVNQSKLISKNLIGVQVINRDYSNVKIEIKDSQNRIVNIIPLSFNNRNGFKLDFSTGFFNIFQKITTYEKLNATSFQNGINTTVDSVFEIKELNKGTNNLSIGILAHGYCRSRSYISPGAAFGFSYTLETKQLNILAGGSLLLGKEQRFILNAGIAFSKVKELTLYKVGVPYDKSFLNNTTDLKLSEKMKGSLFVGITYNLGTLKTRTETRILN